MNNQHPFSEPSPGGDNGLDAAQAFTESQWKQLRPTQPAVDFQRLDALLTQPGAKQAQLSVRPTSESRPVALQNAATRRSWGALAAAWSLGVAVGMLCMLLWRQPVAAPSLADVDVSPRPDATQTVVTQPTTQATPTPSNIPAVHDAELAAVPTPTFTVVGAKGPRAIHSWRNELFHQPLRAGTHLHISSQLPAPTFEREFIQPQPHAGDDRTSTHAELSPMSPNDSTPRGLLKELLEGQDNRVF